MRPPLCDISGVNSSCIQASSIFALVKWARKKITNFNCRPVNECELIMNSASARLNNGIAAEHHSVYIKELCYNMYNIIIVITHWFLKWEIVDGIQLVK